MITISLAYVGVDEGFRLRFPFSSTENSKTLLESANKKSSPKMKKLPQISESNNGTTNRPENTAHFPV